MIFIKWLVLSVLFGFLQIVLLFLVGGHYGTLDATESIGGLILFSLVALGLLRQTKRLIRSFF